VVEPLPSKHEALSSNSSTENKRGEGGKKGRKEGRKKKEGRKEGRKEGNLRKTILAWSFLRIFVTIKLSCFLLTF
jgi:hypothetical protein